MRGAVMVAAAASIGNLLQGCDNANIAGALLYIKREFHLETAPTMEGLIVAMSLIGATIITTFSGPVSDAVGRRPMMVASSLLYIASGLLMLWSPNVYALLLARLIDGFGIGLAVTLVPVYISETAPPEIRGLLNTLPQFSGSGGMFLSYCMIFAMMMQPTPASWRLMLGVLSVPSIFFFILAVFFLPESPRWLVSKGRMEEAKAVLQRLRERDDVSGEMALLVEGLGTGGETEIEEYMVGPRDADEAVPAAAAAEGKEKKINLYGAEEGLSWVAQQTKGQSMLGSVLGLAVSRQGSMLDNLVDPVVTLLGSVHGNLPQMPSRMGSTLFPNFGSMFGGGDAAPPPMPPPEFLDAAEDPHDIESPLLQRRSTLLEIGGGGKGGSQLGMRRFSSLMPGGGEAASVTGIGGGWQLAWKWSEHVGPDGTKKGGYKRMYLREETGPTGMTATPRGVGDEPPEHVHAAALVSRSMLYTKDVKEDQLPVPEMAAGPGDSLAKGPALSDLLEPGVRHALFAGVMIQILQQFSGINGVLYYTPQILDQAGVGIILSKFGLRGDAASILISALTTLLMLPCIGVAMRLMDVSGRRSLLLSTIPVLIVALLVLVISSAVEMGEVVHAVLSTASVIVYFCCFVMGFGPIPNIFCSEIFPTRVRGMCIAICSLTFWFCDIVVTYTLPVMLNSIGLAGVFSIYAAVCCVALVFVFFRVPETKGLPLEVIAEFFSVGSKGVKQE